MGKARHAAKLPLALIPKPKPRPHAASPSTPPAPPPARPPANPAKLRKKPHGTSKRSTALPPADAAAPAVQEERKPIRTPADLAAAIRAAADADVDAAAALALSAPPDVPLPTHSLALLLRRLATTRSVFAARGLLDKLHPAGEDDGAPRPNPAPRGALLALADAVCHRGGPREISGVLPVLRDHGVRADAHLYNALMKAHVAADDPGAVLRVFRQMRSDGVDPDLVTYNTLIFGLARAGMVAKARAFLDAMAAEGHLPDVITYTSLMNGMCVQGDALGALKLLEEMEAKGCQPNERTYNTLLMGLCKNKKLDKAVEVYKSMVAVGMKLESPAYASYVRALCRSGSVADAYEVFDYAIQTKSFTEPIFLVAHELNMGLCNHKKLDKAVEVYKSVEVAVMKLESSAYASFVRVLCRSGSVAGAYEVFDYAIQTKSFTEVTAYSELENSIKWLRKMKS
ncbi:unnamed protein product [Miscanthus lutarioriparius]|uniref:Pentatricopeptide repeat-containing protein n=1 Tax=Miscanthus lutarioriparius TaxID=422564 RepID=A0A811PS02_9POAL|nr:unnamed protein product [Miscanthus lutarioriparius]